VASKIGQVVLLALFGVVTMVAADQHPLQPTSRYRLPKVLGEEVRDVAGWMSGPFSSRPIRASFAMSFRRSNEGGSHWRARA